MKIKEILNSQTFYNVAMTLFTFCLVLFSFLTWLTMSKQTSISNELKNIQVYQNEQKVRLEKQKILEEKKELKIIIENILKLYSARGLNERALHSKKENIELSSAFYQYLLQGLDNYLLANNPKCLKLWVKSLSLMHYFSDKGLISAKKLPDDKFKKLFLAVNEEAWTSVMNVYSELHLSSNYEFGIFNLKNGERNNANAVDAKTHVAD